ncbi:hypothetical protein [uncultured Brevibacillus sp.]|uniref:hypothetical protein n=1 Tax=uncultured Brevibacillus sp. TaxID=169970 RepID=UPI002598117D|nr:hypothetical protein [uncultured Brevibacillus sp.]
MIQSYKATILRKNLKSCQYMPDKLTLIKVEPSDHDAERRYYFPAVNLLGKMYQDLNR